MYCGIVFRFYVLFSCMSCDLDVVVLYKFMHLYITRASVGMSHLHVQVIRTESQNWFTNISQFKK